MRSAVNVGMLPQVIVPDNSHVIGVAKSIGSDIRQGLDKRKAEKEAADNKERAASLAKEIFESRAVGDIPQAVRPQYDPETELRLQQVDLAEKQRLDEIHQKSENAKRATIQASNQRRVLSDAETKANFVELAQLDPQLARFVFQGVTSANEQDRLAVAQEAKRANDLFQNAAYFAQQDLKGGKGGQLDAFLVDAIRQESARGGDVSRLYQMYKASPDERIGLIQRNLALSGTVLRNKEVKRMTEKEAADAALARDKFNQEIAEFNYQVTQDSKEDAPDFKDIQSLRKEFTAETKNFGPVSDAYGRVLASAENPSPAGDLALIINYQKILDPNSVVRQEEFEQAAAAGSYGSKIKAMVGRVKSGKLLTEGQRADFVNRAGRLFKSAENSYRKREDKYRVMAERFGFNPDEVVFDRSVIEAPNPDAERLKAEAQAAIDAGANPAQVNARLQEMLSGQ